MSYALVAVSICMTGVLHILVYLLDLSDRTTGHLPSCWLSHPFDSFLIKEIRRIDKTSNISCMDLPLQCFFHGIIISLRCLIFFFIITTIQEIKAIDEAATKKQLSYVCLSPSAGSGQMTGISGLVHILQSKILATRWSAQLDLWICASGFVELAGKWISGERVFRFLCRRDSGK